MRSAVPRGFVAAGRGVLVRCGYEDEVWQWLDGRAEISPAADADAETSLLAADGDAETPLLAADGDAETPAPAGGRGGARPIALRDGGRAWRRGYRHGGLLRKVLGDVYWDRPPRAWRELVATEAARRSGIAAPEVLAAAARPLASPLCWLHREVLVTRALERRRSLAEALRAATSADERRAWIARAWSTIARLHAAGIRHPDLNATNLLVGAPDAPVAVIDFDRAVAGPRPVGALGRALARRRLARSIAKLALPDLDRASAAELLRDVAREARR